MSWSGPSSRFFTPSRARRANAADNLKRLHWNNTVLLQYLKYRLFAIICGRLALSSHADEHGEIYPGRREFLSLPEDDASDITENTAV
jgi:hypothetical protein